MSYCVHCGVELDLGEKHCPLCLTPIIDPAQLTGETAGRPYPNITETVDKKINRHFGIRLTTALLLFPMAVVLICDLAFSGGFTWSLYVLGALGCLGFWVLLPLAYESPKPYLYILADIVSIVLYLLLISVKTNGLTWYLKLALPLTLISGTAATLSVLIVRREAIIGLNKVSDVIYLVAVSLVGYEMIIDRFIDGTVFFNWSPYAFASLLTLGLVLHFIEKNSALKENIRKRLYI